MLGQNSPRCELRLVVVAHVAREGGVARHAAQRVLAFLESVGPGAESFPE
jgi:hypothetical protein